MMTRIARSIGTGVRLGLLAGLWVLTAELLYRRLLILHAPPLDGNVGVLYCLVFGVFGLLAGLVGAIMRRDGGAPVVAAALGAVVTLIMLGLRLHDLADATFSLPIDGGLALLVAVALAGIAWLGPRPWPDGAATVLLAAYMPLLVLASKLLINTSAIPLAQPIPVALGAVVLWPFMLTAGARRVLAKPIAARVVAAFWIVPLVLLAGTAVIDRSATPSAAARQTAESDAPPIVWITIDTLRADHMSVYGYPVPTTPRMEEFAKTATVYTNAFSQSSGTPQAVPSLLTGLTPYRHGGVSETHKLPETLPTIAEMLRDRGYQTVAESANPWVSERYGMARGFEDFRLYNTDDALFLYDLMKLGMRVAPWEIFELREHLPSYAKVTFAALVDEAAGVLRGHDNGKPLFLYLQPVDPHGPYQPAYRYIPGEGAGLRRGDYVSYWKLKSGVIVNRRQLSALHDLYDGEIGGTDAQLERLFGVLRELDMFDKAMIVITADHGEQFEDHGLWRHSNSLYQQLLHVPLIVKYPNQHDGRVVREPVGTIDIVPSIMKMLGGTCAKCDGRPLQDAGKAPRTVFSYWMAHDEPKALMRSVVADGWKLIRTHKGDMDAEELFFLDQDPSEEHDLRATEMDRVARLRGLLERYEAESGPTETAEAIKLKPGDVERLKALGYVQ